MKYLLYISLFISTIYGFTEFKPSCCNNHVTLLISQDLPLKNHKKVEKFYKNRVTKIAWDEKDFDDFISLARDGAINYLFLDYHQDEIEDLMNRMRFETKIEQKFIRARIDILATDGFFSFAKDLSVGFIDKDKFQSLLKESEIPLVWEKKSKLYYYGDDLKLALKSNLLKVLLHQYLPITDEYKLLVQEYHRYQKMKLPKIDYGKLMRVGDYGYRATQLKAYLYESDDLKDVDKSYMEFPTFDKKLSEALKSFQKRHYIKVTGELDRVTVLYLNKSAKQTSEFIKLNIERHKFLPRIYDREYILINIPEFSLKYFKEKALVDDIFIVVGREDRPTPIFSDKLEYIVLNPSWIVPQSLVRRDYLPGLLENPNYLEEEQIHIHTKPSRHSREINPQDIDWEQYTDEDKKIPNYFMQYPGEHNALGKMKFIFPNKYNVYLHDTNSKSLTTLKYRLYSSGCIRLSKPYDLLYILSQYTNYSNDELIELLSSEKTVNVPLKKHIPIHIRYHTVFIDKESKLAFRKDFYGIDAIQLEALTHN